MFSKSIVALALAGSAIANPLLSERGVCKDACAAAVTGSAALGDSGIRSSHCASFLATTVTPPAITTTVTVTGTSTTSKSAWKRTVVTYCPNKVPVYATAACGGVEAGGAAYSSACACFGFTGDSTTTVAPTTTTKTVYVVPTYASSCSSAVKTVTVTTTASPVGASGSGYVPSVSTVTVTTASVLTVTANSTCASPTVSSTPTTNTTVANSTCMSDATASGIVADFIDFLENTSYQGKGTFNTALALQVLASDFTDWSDSINFMINTQNPGYAPLGTVTFANPGAFIYGQGTTQPEIPLVQTLTLHHDCTTITWRWRANFGYGNPVQGINFMIINAAGQLETNYSEFDNAAWLQNYGNPQCAAAQASAVAAASAAASANCTAATTTATPKRRDIRAHMNAHY